MKYELHYKKKKCRRGDARRNKGKKHWAQGLDWLTSSKGRNEKPRKRGGLLVKEEKNTRDQERIKKASSLRVCWAGSQGRTSLPE